MLLYESSMISIHNHLSLVSIKGEDKEAEAATGYFDNFFLVIPENKIGK